MPNISREDIEEVVEDTLEAIGVQFPPNTRFEDKVYTLTQWINNEIFERLWKEQQAEKAEKEKASKDT